MAKSQVETSEMSVVEKLFALISGLLITALGLVLVLAALDGAEIIPHIILRAEVVYTANLAVLLLLTGQAYVLVGGSLIYLLFRR